MVEVSEFGEYNIRKTNEGFVVYAFLPEPLKSGEYRHVYVPQVLTFGMPSQILDFLEGCWESEQSNIEANMILPKPNVRKEQYME